MAVQLRESITPESEFWPDLDREGRMDEARYFYATHDKFTKLQVGRKFDLIGERPDQYASDGTFLAAVKRRDWDYWREGYRPLVQNWLDVKKRAAYAAQYAANRKIHSKIVDLVDAVPSDDGIERVVNPLTFKTVTNIDLMAKCQRMHTENTTDLARILGEPTEFVKHSGQLDDLNDPAALRERAKRLLEAAQAELERNGTDASGSGTVAGGEDSPSGAGSGAVEGA